MAVVKVGIIGSGNVGTDLMHKIIRSPLLQMGLMMGIDPASEGLARARQLGLTASSNGIDALIRNPELADIVIDATTAKAHLNHAVVLKNLNKKTIDLTPAHIGEMVVPVVNLQDHLDKDNVCLISCGGQATIPIVAAISSVCSVSYAEVVATISSSSAGPGTRQNIDEFTQVTREGIIHVGRVKEAKAIIILNPADPPIMMHNTIYTLVENPNPLAITKAVEEMVRQIQQYVPGYRLKMPPLVDASQVTTMIEVTGQGDFLPPYAGNLDIITSAAVRVAEVFAVQQMRGGAQNE